VRFDIRLKKCGKIARRSKKMRKLTKKLQQLVEHAQNCELAAKRENRRKIATRKIAIFCKGYIC